MTKLSAVRGLPLLAAAIVVTSGCGAADRVASQTAGPTSNRCPDLVGVAQTGKLAEVLVRPATPQQPGSASLRRVDLAAGTASEQALGDAERTALLVAHGAAAPSELDVKVSTAAGGGREVRAARAGGTTSRRDALANLDEYRPAADRRYARMQDANTVSRFNAQGDQQQTYELAKPPADWEVGTVDGRPVKANFGAGTPTIVAVLCQQTADVVVSRNQAGALVTALGAGKSLAVPSLGGVASAEAVGPTTLGLVAYDPQRSSGSLTYVEVDTSRMEVVRSVPLGPRPRPDEQIVSASVVAWGGRVLVHVVQGATIGGPLRGDLYALDSSGKPPQQTHLPDDSGLYMVPSRAGQVALFGGTARGAVRDVDVASLVVSGVDPGLSAPDDSFLQQMAAVSADG